MKFLAAQRQITCAGLVDKYATVLERGPDGIRTLYSLDQLPAEKPLMKAAIVTRAYEMGDSALDILRAAFVSLASFQQDTREPATRYSEIAAEMTVLGLEFDARTKSIRENANAQA